MRNALYAIAWEDHMTTGMKGKTNIDGLEYTAIVEPSELEFGSFSWTVTVKVTTEFPSTGVSFGYGLTSKGVSSHMHKAQDAAFKAAQRISSILYEGIVISTDKSKLRDGEE